MMETWSPEDMPTELTTFPNEISRQMHDLALESINRAFDDLDVGSSVAAALHSQQSSQASAFEAYAFHHTRAFNLPDDSGQTSLERWHALRRLLMENAVLSYPGLENAVEEEQPEPYWLEHEPNHVQAPILPPVRAAQRRTKRTVNPKAHLTRSAHLVETKSRWIFRSTSEKLVGLYGCLSLMLEKGNGTVECTACCSDTPLKEAAMLKCKHKYCRECLNQLVKIGCQSEISWPPRCCNKAVQGRLVAKHASGETTKAYLDLRAQCAIPLQHRWYCPQERCSKPLDIRKARISQSGVQCRHCSETLCVTCRRPSHLQGEPCKSETFELTIQEAERMKWKQCYKCGQMLELYGGCRHIKCTCKAEWW